MPRAVITSFMGRDIAVDVDNQGNITGWVGLRVAQRQNPIEVTLTSKTDPTRKVTFTIRSIDGAGSIDSTAASRLGKVTFDRNGNPTFPFWCSIRGG